MVILITILRAMRVGYDSILYKLSAGFYFWRAIEAYSMGEESGVYIELGSYALVALLGAYRWE